MRKLTVRIKRYDPERDESPRWETYRVEADPTDRVLANRTVADHLASFTPRLGDAVFLRAGTVHSLSGGSWCSKCRKTATSRFACTTGIASTPGQVSLMLCKSSRRLPASISQTALGPVTPVMEATTPVLRERLFHCEQFSVWRHSGNTPFTVGAAGTPRVLVCIDGEGELEYDGTQYPFGRGDVVLLPAEVGACSYRPRDAVTLLEVALPE